MGTDDWARAERDVRAPEDLLYDILLCGTAHMPATQDALAWRVGKVFRDAGPPHRDPYIMRHTFASIMDHNDVKHQKIADLTGHKNLAMFYAVYRHMMYLEVNETSDTMNNAFGKRKVP